MAQLREQEVLEVLIGQGAVIPCYRCRVAFTPEDVKSKNIENEGMTSLQIWFKDLPRDLQAKVKPYLDNTLKAEADRFDAQAFAASGTAA